MRKAVIQLPDALTFAQRMSGISQKKYTAICGILAEQGFAYAPLAEKVDGEENLFAIRVMTKGNERFFYCYASGDFIYVLCGYEKRSNAIPKRQIAKAKAIKREYDLYECKGT
jgi:hypothetical protein